MDSAAHYLSKNVYFNICHGKNSKVTAIDKFQKFRVDTPLKLEHKTTTPIDESELVLACFGGSISWPFYASNGEVQTNTLLSSKIMDGNEKVIIIIRYHAHCPDVLEDMKSSTTTWWNIRILQNEAILKLQTGPLR